MKIESSGLSDRGRKRDKNEDSYFTDPELGLYLVSDGMGGFAGGEVASDLTVSTIADFVKLAKRPKEMTWPFGYRLDDPYEHNVIRTAVDLASLKVGQAAEELEHYAGMGATVVTVWVRGDKAFYSHVGDSRFYLLRDGGLRQATLDHTLVQEQITRGIITPEEAEDHALRHVVTKAIGTRERLEIEVHEENLTPGDVMLLCSDGLTDCLDNSEIEEILSADADVKQVTQALIQRANEKSGHDNITTVVIKVAEHG